MRTPRPHATPRASLRRPRSRAAAFGLGVALLGACGSPSQGARLAPEYNPDTGQLERLAYDANQNGVAESVSFFRGSRIERIEVDVDEDGRVDRWEHYGADGRLVKVGFSRRTDGRENAWSFADAAGAIQRIEIAAGDDPTRVTRTEYFEREALVRAEEDTDADGRVDKWEWYEQGRLARLAFSEPGGATRQEISYAADGSVQLASNAGQ